MEAGSNRQIIIRAAGIATRPQSWELGLLIGLFLLVFLVRAAYDRLEVEQLSVLLAPTATMISAITNSPSVFSEGQGFIFPELSLVLDRSCGGGHFMILLLALFIWWSRKQFIGIHKRPWLPLALIAAAFPLTIAANVMRVLCSLIALQIDPTTWVAGTATAHQWIGILVQLVLIIISHAILRYTYRRPGAIIGHA